MEGPAAAAVRIRLFVLFLVAFVLLYASADLLTSLHPFRISMGLPRWPFFPEAVAIYISLDLLIPLTFALVPRARLGLFTLSLLLATAWAWPLFVLLPLQPIPLPEGFQPGWLFRLADGMNLDANLLPSLHVTYALLCAAALRSWWGWLWASSIALSTLLTHQHYTVDVLAGLALALLTVRSIDRIEALCLQEFARCAARHRRYAVIALGLYLASLGRAKARRLARVGFCYLQHLDDLLDGQQPCQSEPEEIAEAHQSALQGSSPFPSDELGALGSAFAYEFSQRGLSTELAVEVIGEMRLDRQRVREQRLLTEVELDRHLERTFELSLDLMLLAADSPLRARQAPHLLKALGWCSVIRDYAEDQQLGLINVPREVWEGGTTDAWFAKRHVQVADDLQKADRELESLKGQSGYRLLRLFLRSVERYARDPKRARPTSP